MNLKRYKEFIAESNSSYEFGCVYVNFNIDNWNKIVSKIDTADLYEPGDSKYGISKDPHVTLLYGLHDRVTLEQVKDSLKDTYDGLKIEIDGVGLFENEKYDVLKLNVKKTEKLKRIFEKLSELPNSNEYKTYNPHITIAYLKRGTGKKYLEENLIPNIDNKLNIKYSKPDGTILNVDFEKLKPVESNITESASSNNVSIFDVSDYLSDLFYNRVESNAEYLKWIVDHFIGDGIYDIFNDKIDKIISKLRSVPISKIRFLFEDFGYNFIYIDTWSVSYGVSYIRSNIYIKDEYLENSQAKSYLLSYFLKDIINMAISEVFLKNLESDPYVNNKEWQIVNLNIQKYDILEDIKKYDASLIFQIGEFGETRENKYINSNILEETIKSDFIPILEGLNYEKIEWGKFNKDGYLLEYKFVIYL